MKEGQLHIN